jgi:4-hydroxyacetophenone monooxygenase
MKLKEEVDINLDEYERTVDAALRAANLNALRMALYQLTGDEMLLSLPMRKVRHWGETWQLSVLAPEGASAVQEAARKYLHGKRGQSSASVANKIPDRDTLRCMMEAYTGDMISPVVERVCEEELAFDVGIRNVKWRERPAAKTLESFRVIIVGAGMAGLAMGIQLQRLNIPYTIVERYDGIGGTWWINTYPDCRVDLLSHHYEFSFEKNWPWQHYFATQPELRAYLEHCAKKYGVAEHIRLSTELVSAEWNEDAVSWKIELKDLKTGAVRPCEANVLISATGVFHTPVTLDVEGTAEFSGKIVHTARWNQDVEVKGKRVALVGNGSSGVQLMPWLAKNAEHLTVFQRTPSWMMDVEGYKSRVLPEEQWLFDNMPFYLDWHRFGLLYFQFDETGPLQEYDPEWQKQGGHVSARHDRVARAWSEYIHKKLADFPELLQKSLPRHMPWSKRPVADSGWYDALKQPNVDLVAQGIQRLTRKGIVAADGMEHEVDLIVLASGFQTQKYLWPVQYVGRDGMTLEQLWQKDGARAHLGMTMPHFPNFFMLYGPNGQGRTVSNFQWSELWARYVAQAVREMLEGKHKSMEVKQAVFEEYNVAQDEAMTSLIWNEQNQDSYYKNAYGRVGHNMPWRASTYIRMIENLQPSDYEFSNG